MVCVLNIFSLVNQKIVMLARYQEYQAFKKEKRQSFTPFVKLKIACKQKYQCNICHILLPECFDIDHINPLFLGGNNDLENLQAICVNCHAEKTRNERSAFYANERKHKYPQRKFTLAQDFYSCCSSSPYFQKPISPPPPNIQRLKKRHTRY